MYYLLEIYKVKYGYGAIFRRKLLLRLLVFLVSSVGTSFNLSNSKCMFKQTHFFTTLGFYSI